MTGAQSRTIFGLARELALSHDDLQALALQLTGKDRLSSLADSEVSALISRLRELQGQRRIASHRPGRATAQQLWLQRQLAADVGLSQGQLQAFIVRMTHVDRPEWQTQRDASNVIEGLKKMIARGGREADGATVST